LKTECTNIRPLLSEYIDGMLDASEMSAVRGHLHACKDCNREYEALNSLLRKMGDIQAVKAPDDFLAKVHEKINERPSPMDRIRDLFDFSRIRIPIEAAAFALTAVLILSLFYILPNEEKTKIARPAAENSQLTTGTEIRTAQIPEGSSSAKPSMETPPPAPRIEAGQTVVKLALSLNITQAASPIPSQSVSFGNSEAESENSFQNLWPDENEPARKILPIEINSKIDEVIKSVGGVIISREYKTETGYPARLTAEIPGGNYRKFITESAALGVLKTPAPAFKEGLPQDKVLIQLEFTAD
jgi:hypothetical protein